MGQSLCFVSICVRADGPLVLSKHVIVAISWRWHMTLLENRCTVGPRLLFFLPSGRHGGHVLNGRIMLPTCLSKQKVRGEPIRPDQASRNACLCSRPHRTSLVYLGCQVKGQTQKRWNFSFFFLLFSFFCFLISLLGCHRNCTQHRLKERGHYTGSHHALAGVCHWPKITSAIEQQKNVCVEEMFIFWQSIWW